METPTRERIGLCFGCRHARKVPTPRALYWLCERSATDPAFDRYPRLPIRECPGYEPGEPAGPPADPPAR